MLNIRSAGGDGASLSVPGLERWRLFGAWSVAFRAAGGPLITLRLRVMTVRRMRRHYRAEMEDPAWAVLHAGQLVVMARLDC
jgi:hypothetical protein